MKTVSFSDLPFLRYWGPPPAEIGFRTYLQQLIAGLQSQFRAEFAYIPVLDYIDLADSENEDRFIFRPTVSKILGPPAGRNWFSNILATAYCRATNSLPSALPIYTLLRLYRPR